MSAALTDCEVSSVGSSTLNTHIRPSESHTCGQGEVENKQTKKPNPGKRSARDHSDKYSTQKMAC